MGIRQTDHAELLRKFEDKEYRDAYAASFQRQIIAFQLRAIREKRGWTQAQLGEYAHMLQERISVYENPEEPPPRLTTLNKLGAALDVAWLVRAVTFQELASWIPNMTQELLAVPSYDEAEHEETAPPGSPSNVITLLATGSVDRAIPIAATGAQLLLPLHERITLLHGNTRSPESTGLDLAPVGGRNG